MAESNGLLNRRTGNRTGGSNPPLSAIFFAKKMANEAVRLRPCGLRRDEQDFSSLSAVALREGGTQNAQPFLPCHGVMQWSRDIFTKTEKPCLLVPP